MINAATMGTPIMAAMTGIKNPAAWMSSRTKSLTEGKDRLCFSPSIIGRIACELTVDNSVGFDSDDEVGVETDF